MLVEGESDEKTLPLLVQKIAPHSTPKVRNLRGKGNLLNINKVASHINFAYHDNRDINKVLLCIDSECTDIGETHQLISPMEHALQQSFPNLHVKYVVVDHSLEGWLLQDRDAIQETLGRNSKLPQYGNPEEKCRPAELLQEIFEKNGNDYKKTMHAPRLAGRLNTEMVARASQTFKDFQQAVRS